MFSKSMRQEYYQALIKRDSAYEGVFFVGITTTGIFCRPTCPARKPKFENCEFFAHAKEALFSSYRPCKRCSPLCAVGQMSPIVQRLVEAVEKEPEKRWKEKDFARLATNAKQASRAFKRYYNMTFVAYARARRMGIALKEIKDKKCVIEGQLSAGYESSSGFRDAFSAVMGAPPIHSDQIRLLSATWIESPLGPMIGIGDDKALYLLEFIDRRSLEKEVERLRKKLHCAVIPGSTPILEQLKNELDLYWKKELKEFTTPLEMVGTPFQKRVWNKLRKLPLGQTISYAGLAKAIGSPHSYRAVANANGANQFTLIIPCHRVINTNGELGGYGGGLSRKKWLLDHEGAKYSGKNLY